MQHWWEQAEVLLFAIADEARGRQGLLVLRRSPTAHVRFYGSFDPAGGMVKQIEAVNEALGKVPPPPHQGLSRCNQCGHWQHNGIGSLLP